MDGPWKTRISEPRRDEFSRWHGDDAARRAVYNNRTRLLSGVARQAFKLRAELVERGFALILDRGGMRRVWLRGRENVQKRYLIHVAGYNLGLIMRLLTGAGTPREFRVPNSVWLLAYRGPDGGLGVIMFGYPAIMPLPSPLKSDRTRSVEKPFCNGLLGFDDLLFEAGCEGYDFATLRLGHLKRIHGGR